MMAGGRTASLKPAYLIHGDDHGAIAERRAGLKALAERMVGAGGVEIVAGDVVGADGIVAALARMTLTMALGDGEVDRVVLVDGAERLKQAEVEKTLAAAMAAMPPGTTLALFAREDARAKAPKALHAAVQKAGGQIVCQATVKPWELPKWVAGQAAKLGLKMDAAAAKALVLQVGERQQRLLRELEKLALQLPDGQSAGGGNGPAQGAVVGVEEIERLSAHSRERRAFTLADALVAGDAAAAMRDYIALEGQGERLAGMIYLIASRLREALAVAGRLEAGEAAGSIARSLRMPQRAASRLVSDVAAADPERLRRAVRSIASLELDLRGGSGFASDRRPAAALSEQTQAVRAIESIAR